MSVSKKIVLKSSDGQDFDVDEAVAFESKLIKDMIENDCANSSSNTISLPINVKSNILSKVIDYCKRHFEANKEASHEEDEDDDELLNSFDAEFVKVDENTVFDLLLAADDLKIERLFNLICDTTAEMHSRMTADELRKLYKITPEQEKEIRKSWNMTEKEEEELVNLITPEELEILLDSFAPEEKEEIMKSLK